MIGIQEKEELTKHFESLTDQLTDLRNRAPSKLQSKINLAFASLESAKLRAEGNKDFGEVLYLLGRVSWTIGYVMGQPKEE